MEDADTAESSQPARPVRRWPASAAASPTSPPPEATAAAPASPGRSESAPQQQDPRVRITEVLNRLKSSGPPSGGWTTDAGQVFEKWQNNAPAGRSVDLTDFGCFGEGCTMTATYRDTDAYQQLTHDFQESEPFKTWPGRRFRSGPVVLPSGAVQATWVLYRP